MAAVRAACNVTAATTESPVAPVGKPPLSTRKPTARKSVKRGRAPEESAQPEGASAAKALRTPAVATIAEAVGNTTGGASGDGEATCDSLAALVPLAFQLPVEETPVAPAPAAAVATVPEAEEVASVAPSTGKAIGTGRSRRGGKSTDNKRAKTAQEEEVEEPVTAAKSPATGTKAGKTSASKHKRGDAKRKLAAEEEAVTKKEESEQEADSEEEEEEVTCAVCGESDATDDSAEEVLWLLCDKCDRAFHPACQGVTAIPEGDWFCTDCTGSKAGSKKRGRAAPTPAPTPVAATPVTTDAAPAASGTKARVPTPAVAAPPARRLRATADAIAEEEEEEGDVEGSSDGEEAEATEAAAAPAAPVEITAAAVAHLVDTDISKMTVTTLRQELSQLGLSTAGIKKDLATRLEEAIASAPAPVPSPAKRRGKAAAPAPVPVPAPAPAAKGRRQATEPVAEEPEVAPSVPKTRRQATAAEVAEEAEAAGRRTRRAAAAK